MKVIRVLILLAFSLTLLACQSMQRIGEDNYQPAIAQLRKIKRIEGVYVLKNGEAVIERYFYGSKRNDLNSLNSVTKSISAILLGIALEKEFIKSLDQPLSEFYPELVSLNPKITQITLRHIAAMKSGLEWDEGKDIYRFIAAKDAAQAAILRVSDSEPGTVWNYDSGTSHLITAIIGRASEMNVEDFANRFLFAPLGITHYQWDNDDTNTPYGSFGLQMRVKDLAIIGQMVLQKGRWQDQQIISESWINQMMLPTFRFPPSKSESMKERGYGLLWWLANVAGEDIHYASGYGGQYLILIPKHKVVIAIMSEWDWPATNSSHGMMLSRVIGQDLIPVLTKSN